SIGVITGNKSIECGFKMSPEENAALGGPYSIGDREFNFFDIETIPLSHLRAAWETPLENVFPTRAGTHRVSIPPELMRLPATKARA
ncbi:MAG: hypothetical protein LBR07_01195, partial [Puniceicoccales bacterium]|nr:hypothetical protein [Puniceicoccales bacterium]